MRKSTQRSPEDLEVSNEGYLEIGKSLAAMVVDGGYTELWAWRTIRDLGNYRRWMVSDWVARYRSENGKRKS